MMLCDGGQMGGALEFLPGELWFGGAVTDGVRQPYSAGCACTLELRGNPTPNQMMPLLLSTRGRWLWNPDGMRVRLEHGRIRCTQGTQAGRAGGTLRSAYLDAMARFFPFSGRAPSHRLLEAPVYNTWIELTFHQRQEAVLRYAGGVLEHGLPAGVLMIDDGWSDYYGRWAFSAGKFPDAPGMLRALHAAGFSVMLWVCPFITPDTCEYRALEEQGLLVRDGAGRTHVAHWWNGYSAVLDMTLPAAQGWLQRQLDALSALGVDGFKFDAGDSLYYPADGSIPPDVHSRAWARFGAQYPLNEFRVTAGAGGWPLMQRLCDKDHSWGATGLAALVPDAVVQSMTGHPFLCPDMIGGGEYRNFYGQGALDEELFVRWAQAACLMPVMQFSAAPWRVLSEQAFGRVRGAVETRARWLPVLRAAWDHCARTGEPILRPMAYQFPEEPCAAAAGQFMVGETLLAAPLLEKGAAERAVYLPRGVWRMGERRIASSGGVRRFSAPGGAGPLVFVKTD